MSTRPHFFFYVVRGRAAQEQFVFFRRKLWQVSQRVHSSDKLLLGVATINSRSPTKKFGWPSTQRRPFPCETLALVHPRILSNFRPTRGARPKASIGRLVMSALFAFYLLRARELSAAPLLACNLLQHWTNKNTLPLTPGRLPRCLLSMPRQRAASRYYCYMAIYPSTLQSM